MIRFAASLKCFKIKLLIYVIFERLFIKTVGSAHLSQEVKANFGVKMEGEGLMASFALIPN